VEFYCLQFFSRPLRHFNNRIVATVGLYFKQLLHFNYRTGLSPTNSPVVSSVCQSYQDYYPLLDEDKV
jgi:hypothetical protein